MPAKSAIKSKSGRRRQTDRGEKFLLTALGQGPEIGSSLMRRLVTEYRSLPAVVQPIEEYSRVFLSDRLRSEAVVRAVFSWSVPELLQTVLDDFAQEAQERPPIPHRPRRSPRAVTW